MQTFPKVQRNRITQKNLGYFLVIFLLGIYGFLGDIFVFLPPLLGIMFILFARSMQERKISNLFFIFIFLLWIECDKGLALGALTLFFVFSYFVLFLPMEFLFTKNSNFIYILLVYLGIFLFLACLGSYSQALEWKEFLGLCVYYAILEGVVVRAFKI